MFYPVRLQIRLAAEPARVWRALTDTSALQAWFCEFADINLAEQRYDFWGRYTTEAPDRDSGRHTISEAAPAQRLIFDWRLKGAATVVNIGLLARDAGTILTVRQKQQADSTPTETYWMEDFWFLVLENLRRYLDGKPCEARVDFSMPMKGNIRHTTDIDAPADRVFDVLTNPSEIDRWIASKATVDLKPGGTYSLGWGESVPAAKILDVEPGKRLSYTWDEGSDPSNSKPTVITWTLEDSSGKTRLTFIHSGFDDDQDVSGIFTGWRSFVNWVRSVAEYGADWQPPLSVVSPPMTAYPAAILNAQDQIVAELREA